MAPDKVGETKSYRDPSYRDLQSVFVQDDGAARREYEASFPRVETTYDAFHFTFEATNKRGTTFLAGSEGIIASELTIAFENESAQILARDGDVIARLDEDTSMRLYAHHEQQWVIKAFLSISYYHEAEKRFFAEAACMCYDSMLDQETKLALETFIANITYRIAKATHPGIELSQEQYQRVIESKGAWYLTKKVALPEREPGVMHYKRRRTWTETLVLAAMSGNVGCKIGTWIFWIVVVGGVAAAIWWFFFR